MKWYNYLGCPTVKPRPVQIRPENPTDFESMTWKDMVGFVAGLMILLALFAGVIYMVAVGVAKALNG